MQAFIVNIIDPHRLCTQYLVQLVQCRESVYQSLHVYNRCSLHSTSFERFSAGAFEWPFTQLQTVCKYSYGTAYLCFWDSFRGGDDDDAVDVLCLRLLPCLHLATIEPNTTISSAALPVPSSWNCSSPWTCAYLLRSSKSLWARPDSDPCRARRWTFQRHGRSSPLGQPPGSLRGPRKGRWWGRPRSSYGLASRSWSASWSSHGRGPPLTVEVASPHRRWHSAGRLCCSTDCVDVLPWRKTGQTGHASDHCPYRSGQRRFGPSPAGGACDACHVSLSRWWRRHLEASLACNLQAN